LHASKEKHPVKLVIDPTAEARPGLLPRFELSLVGRGRFDLPQSLQQVQPLPHDRSDCFSRRQRLETLADTLQSARDVRRRLHWQRQRIDNCHALT
jgi:hypothetical protein